MNKKPLDTTHAGSKNQFAGSNKTTNTGGYTAPTATGKHDQTRTNTNTNFNKPTIPTASKNTHTTQGGWKDKSHQGGQAGWKKDDNKGGGTTTR